ncbi:MAG: DUF4440 domain-containing protein [Pseudorhodoplanes sp.]|jgi:hypothetical protein|nr:DUF4440 domain-containing protein [Pseudorhodoplanes sp.]
MKGALVLVLPLFVACSTVAESRGSDASQLEHASQALLDAVTSGDKAVFARTLDPEGLFSDEDGNVRTGAAVVQEVRGLPSGYSGNLRMVDPHVRIRGDVGIVAFDVAETLELFGQRLSTRFHTTDVYQRTDEGWQLVASQTSVLPSELSRAAVDPTVFDDYIGTYRLSAEISARIWREDDQLFMQRTGRAREELIPIGNDRFVRAGAPRGERFFRRDNGGNVVALVDRRDNNDLIWRRD